jgi:predicted GH43/DUF377 family glycosyl hydrolase
MLDFYLAKQDELTFICLEPLASMFKLSPCVWQEGTEFKLLLRVVNRAGRASEKVARVHYGTSPDGLTFSLDEEAVIAPGPDVPGSYDSGGCEDPTLARVDGRYYVYYSGWNEHLKRGELLLATGSDIHHLEKRGIALESSQRAANPKEATIAGVSGGGWRLFFEYADENRSKIGLARSASAGGPWEVLAPLFSPRPDSWDSWHLSTGPILDSDPRNPVMFYNGASPDARWRIGWVEFDADYTRVLSRSINPLVLPGDARGQDDTDIAFAASALAVGDEVHLYYSISDRYCMRAIVRRR